MKKYLRTLYFCGKTACNLLYRDIQKTNKELQGVTVSKASATISKEWKKKRNVEEEEQEHRHGEALQRYQEDNMDEMEIINFHKKCNKKDRKVLQPKALSKSDEPKKVSGPIDDPSEKEKKPKKAPSNGKKTTIKAEKKMKKTP